MSVHFKYSSIEGFPELSDSFNSLSTLTHVLPAVEDQRLFNLNECAPNLKGDYVLYWMIAHRRVEWNFGLQRAAWWSLLLQKPLLIFEPLRIGYKWASDRHHQWIIDGMKDQDLACQNAKVTYYPYVEPKEGAGKGLLKALSQKASVVITDEYPCFFLPRMVRRAAQVIECHMESVDSNGVLPLQKSDRTYTTAASFRRFLQKTILPQFQPLAFPCPAPLDFLTHLPSADIDTNLLQKWPMTDLNTFSVSTLEIDHSVCAIEGGGRHHALKRLDDFIDSRLNRYHQDRNQVDACAASGLSAYIHFGQISVHEIIQRAFQSCNWDPSQVAPKVSGSRSGWWGASEAVESFIDEIITWRELGFVFNYHNPETYDQYTSLPAWALKTLKEHEDDPRPVLYTLDRLDQAKTHDPIWNAAQRQLVQEGRIHNYLRMLWGKKIFEWSQTPQEALERLIHLNNRYALDGRDPNSYSGIFWCLGRFDRAWGPERPIFGKIRFMTSKSTKSKLKLKNYLIKYGPSESESLEALPLF